MERCKAGSLQSEDAQSRGNIENQDERLAQALADIERGREFPARFETQLLLEGFLPRFEQAGIVPAVENPNPYNTGDELDRHEKWWDDHPQETETFLQLMERRNEILRVLYVGALVGSGPWEIP